MRFHTCSPAGGWQLSRAGYLHCGRLSDLPSPLMDHHLLTAHMAQHLLLMTVAAPLILLGAPVIVLLNGLPQPFGRLVSGPLLRCPPVQAFGRPGHAPGVLLVRRHGNRDRMAHSRSVRAGDAVGSGGMKSNMHAFFAAGILFWWPVVQPWPSLAKWPAMGRSLVPFPCDLTVRRAVGVSYVLRPRCLSALSVDASALRYLTSRRPGVCGRADVGLGHVCLSGSGSRGHNPDAFPTRACVEA